jgi:hypothetical protein
MEVTVGVTAVTSVAVAVAVTEVSATDVAVMVMVLPDVGIVPGAVYCAVFGFLIGSGTVMVPIPVRVVDRDHFTSLHVGFVVRLHPGLLTVAVYEKFSVVPTVAVDGVMVMLIPVMMVIVALAVLEVSACAVDVIVAVGAIVVVPLDAVVGIVAGAV